jgi:hypothetical protein
VTTYAQDLNRACLAFLRAEYIDSQTHARGNDNRARAGRPLRARSLSPAQALAQRVLRYADPFTLPDDEPTEANTHPGTTDTTSTTSTTDATPTTPTTDTATIQQRVRLMRAQGLRPVDIARALGMSPNTIQYWLSDRFSEGAAPIRKYTRKAHMTHATVETAPTEHAPVEPAPTSHPASHSPSQPERVNTATPAPSDALAQLLEVSEQIRALTKKREALLAPLRAEREALRARLAHLEAVLK